VSFPLHTHVAVTKGDVIVADKLEDIDVGKVVNIDKVRYAIAL